MKKYLLLAFFLLIPLALGEYPAWGETTDAKSQKDPIYIEMGDSLPLMMPATVKVYINDPLVRKEANYVEIFSGNAYPYSLSGEKIHINPSGEFRQVLPYNGEASIEFGFRPQDTPGEGSDVSVEFYKAVKTQTRDWPDTSTPGSELYQYNCNLEYNDIFGCGKDGCVVCGIALGTAIRDFVVSESGYEISVPGRFSFAKYTDTDPNTRLRSDFQRYTYSEEKTMAYSSGSSMDIPDQYVLEFEFDSSFWNAKEWGEYSTNFYSSQGYEKGTCDEKICEFIDKDVIKGGDWEPTGAKYIAYVNYPPGGLLKVTAMRNTGMETGAGDAETEKVISEASAFAKSYALSPGKTYRKEGLRNVYSVRGKAESPVTSDQYIWGTVSDTDANPMPYMQLIAKVQDRIFRGATDGNGDFQIQLTGLEIKEGEELPLLFAADFSYVRDGKNYFNIYDRDGNAYNRVMAGQQMKIKGNENTEVHFRIDGNDFPELRYSVASADRLKHLSAIYYHMHEAVDYSLTKLKANIDYKLPVDVWVGNTEGKTHYDMTNSDILIAANTASYDSKDRPKNREYHEFMHHLMYSEYGDFATGRKDPGSVPHAGYINPNTGDSWTEGFAEFMAMAIAKDRGDKAPQMYSYWGDLETNNYKAWDAQGKYEEFAVSSLLWDMYDSTNEKGDSLTIPMEDLWPVIRIKRADVYDYYKAFRQAFPKKSKEIDDVFIMHGFFADTTPGNRAFDNTEPWKWTNQQAGSFIFVDLADNDTSKIIWKQGMAIGRATNYERANRTSAVRHESAYLKVDERVDFYRVKVDYADGSLQDYEYAVEQREGRIYISPLPWDVQAVISVVPDSADFTMGKPFSIGNREMSSSIFSSKEGYFAEHDFGLKATGKHEDKKFEAYGGIGPDYRYEGDPGGSLELIKGEAELSSGNISGSKGSGFPWPILMLAIAACGLGALFTANKAFRARVVKGTSKAGAEFKEHAAPALKAAAKKAAEYSVKAGKAAIHYSKKGYEKAKPHMAKLKNKVSQKLKK